MIYLYKFVCKQNLDMKFTLVIKKGKSNYLVGQLKELPAVFTQGKDIQELRENIADALELYLEEVN